MSFLLPLFLATHDEKIMGYLRRILHLEDGEVVKDEIIDKPKFGA